VFLVIGFLLAIWLVDRIGRIPLQVVGFTMMTVALAVLAVAEGLPCGGSAHLALVFLGFAVFNTFMNAGPNATTYTLAAEVFPSECRAAGQGFAAACAKMGAAIGVFLFPILLDDIGTSALLGIVAGASLLALVVTVAFRIETRGRALDEVAGRELAPLRPRPTPP
jgi:MFS family permease